MGKETVCWKFDVRRDSYRFASQWFTPFRDRAERLQVVQDRETGRSKGFGFVEMDNDAQALAAIQGLNDHEHDGQRIVVSEAKPKIARTSSLAGGSF